MLPVPVQAAAVAVPEVEPEAVPEAASEQVQSVEPEKVLAAASEALPTAASEAVQRSASERVRAAAVPAAGQAAGQAAAATAVPAVLGYKGPCDQKTSSRAVNLDSLTLPTCSIVAKPLSQRKGVGFVQHKHLLFADKP